MLMFIYTRINRLRSRQ